jgi:hypothetical protein
MTEIRAHGRRQFTAGLSVQPSGSRPANDLKNGLRQKKRQILDCAKSTGLTYSFKIKFDRNKSKTRFRSSLWSQCGPRLKESLAMIERLRNQTFLDAIDPLPPCGPIASNYSYAKKQYFTATPFRIILAAP